MRIDCLGILAFWASLSITSVAEGTEDEPCSSQDTSLGVEYHRLHQIPIEDEHTLPMVTPGGMILERTKMVAATDVLLIYGKDSSALCFRLLTFAKHRHECRLSGIARSESPGSYVFMQQESSVRFTILSINQVQVDASDKGRWADCDPLGRIDPAIYVLATSAK